MKRHSLSVEDVKAVADGRWLEILERVAGIPRELLDEKGHPCPKCGGTDRFSLIDAEAGAVRCRKCFAKNNGDGLAALQWMLSIDFREALRRVAEYLGLNPSSAIAAHAGRDVPSNGTRRIIATYDYRDEAGNLLLQIVRFEPKDFRQRRPRPGGGWDWSVKGVRVVPYRLPELLAADPQQPIWICEGEKDADSLARLGLEATCNAGGAGKWTAEHSAFLRGHPVNIPPDNDEAGRKHAQQVAQSLQGIAELAWIVELPGLPEKGDVSDWLAARRVEGWTNERIRSELVRLADEAEPLDLAAFRDEKAATGSDFQTGPVLTCMADIVASEVTWLWPGRVPVGRITLLVGKPGEGKSFLTLELAAHVTTGTSWPDSSNCPKGDVILLAAEDNAADTIRPRLDALGADVNRVHLLSAVRRNDGDKPHERMIRLGDIADIETALTKCPDCKLVVVDPVGSFLGSGTDAHRDNEVREVLTPLARLAEMYGVALLIVAHRRKSSANFADDLAMGSVGFTGVARAVWHVSRDPEHPERRLLLPGKNNLAAQGHGLAFAIRGEPPRIEWETGPVEMSADDALAEEQTRRRGPAADVLVGARDWLQAELAESPRPASELQQQWQERGGSLRTLNRAKELLDVCSFREKVPGPWFWSLSTKDANSPEGEERGNLGNLAETSTISAHSDPAETNIAKFKNLGTVKDDAEEELHGIGPPVLSNGHVSADCGTKANDEDGGSYGRA